MNKTPIEPSEIRKGDLIRWESGQVNEAAEEWRSHHDHPYKSWGQHYLLDRPKPTVDLPTDPTLGWAAWGTNPEPGGRLAVWDRKGHDLVPAASIHTIRGLVSAVTAFTPATAVPTEALDKLRDEEERALNSDSIDDKNDIRRDAIFDFLAAIDEANR